MASIISKMTPTQVAALTTSQIAKLQSSDVAALTPAMIDAMDLNPSDGQFEALTSKQIIGLSNLAVAALSSTQLNQLTTATFAALTKTQVAYISTGQISGLDNNHIKALTSVQITGLTTGEVAKLTAAQLSQLSTASVAALSSSQIGAFVNPVDKTAGADVTGTVAGLTPTQFAALSSAALPGLEASDIITKDATNGWLGVTTAQLAALTSKQITGLAVDDIGRFTAAQLNALNTGAFAALTKTQVAAINSTQVSALDADHLGALTSAQVSGLSVGAMGKLLISQIDDLSAAAVGALSSAQLGALADGVIKGFTAEQFAALASSAMPGLDAADITSLGDGSAASNALLAALTSKQTPGLANADIALFSAAQFNELDPTAFAALSKTQVAAIAIAEISDLDVDHVGALTSAQITGLSTAAIAALDDGTVTGQVAALSTAAIAALSEAQVDALGPDGVAALTSDQFAALPSKALAGLTAGDISGYSDDGFTPTAGTLVASVPTLVSSSPLNNATAFAAGDNITLTFSEDVQFGTGDINVKTGAVDLKFAVATGTTTTGTVTVEGRTVTIDAKNALTGSAIYDIIIDDTAILDKSGVAFDGAAAGDVKFTVAPLLSTAQQSTGPAALDNDTDVAITDNFILTFTENMKAGVGNIIISSTDGSDIRTIPVSDTNQVGIAAAVVTINPTANLLPNTDYFVQLASGTLVDSSADVAAYAGITDETTLNFKTAADAVVPVPTLVVNTATSLDTNFVLRFTEDVTAVAGKNIQLIRTTGAATIETFDATDPQVSIAGKYVTINPTNSLPAADTYYLLMDAGAFEDSSGNDSAAVTLPATLSSAILAVTDTSFISLPLTLSPADDENVAATPVANTNLTVTFGEKVMPGAGNITIRSNDGSDIRVIDIHDSQVDFVTNIATFKIDINPTSDLKSNTSYSVQIDGGAITDYANNSYAGISNTLDWNFTTIDTPPSVVSSSPADDGTLTTATPVAINSNIVLVYNEPVKANAGNIVLTPSVGAVTNVDVTTSQVSIVGNTVTINPTNDLLPNVTYALTAAAGVFKDVDGAAAGDSSAVIDGTNDIDFVTADTIAPELGFVTTGATTAPVNVGFTGAGASVGLVFNEAVYAGSGNIVILERVIIGGASNPTRIIPITDAQVTINPLTKSVAITPTSAFVATSTYSIVMDDGVIVDADGNSYIPGSSALAGAPTLTGIGLAAAAAAANEK